MRIFSGIQPTGQMHIGNYLGATRNWVNLQNEHSCLYTVVDLHALTTLQNPKELHDASFEKVVELLAIGLDPERCALFIQSHVKEHTELAWIFSTLTPVAELERMTQFKDKSKKNKTNINTGLLTYPVLIAADILLYQPDKVPVGKDQIQHLELTRMITRKFNTQFGQTFKEPEVLLIEEAAKIMSLEDQKKKMSKSDGPAAYISLFEEPEAIRKKVSRATTDTGKEIRFNPAKKPGISNLITIYSLFAEESVHDVEKKFADKGYAAFKKATAELLIEKLEPFRQKKQELFKRELYIQEILKQGAKRARSIAETTMQDVRSKIGLLLPN